jgi:hypothetical protein
MTEETGRQSGPGKTGGLPGDHADPRTRELPEDQSDDTVAMGDVARVDEDDAVAGDAAAARDEEGPA